ncbi:hypothetical protein [Jiulongibacter sediminis]|uniref:hypothetical protein n=1 Tax=Jiulongibacter sediminis TaxID=1605367 RepID=UPI0026F34DB5|nr:hypothetical protein [Jiulongibacter sediminis]
MLIKINSLLLLFIFVSCTHVNRTNEDSNNAAESNSPDVDFDEKVDASDYGFNFYFENSLSMDGYLVGADFQKAINRIYNNLPDSSLSSYFVNTREYSVDNLKDRINAKNLESGDRRNSDHVFIFRNAIKSTQDASLSVVVTDGIYSVKGANLNLVSIEIEKAFQDALEISETETVVIKMTSEFVGNYFTSTCTNGKPEQAKVINQNRPYYILLFGNSFSINNFLEENLNDLKDVGFVNIARFSLNKNIEVPYTILTRGEEKVGEFESPNFQRLTHQIKNIKKAKISRFDNSKTNNTFLQFAVPVDFSKTNLPNSYITNLNNYTLSKELGYKIEAILEKDDILKDSKTDEELQTISEKNNIQFSHLIIVKGSTNLIGKLDIRLNNYMPLWIEETGSQEDCNITGETTTTFAFSELMNGIFKAYKKVNKREEIVTLNIEIKN